MPKSRLTLAPLEAGQIRKNSEPKGGPYPEVPGGLPRELGYDARLPQKRTKSFLLLFDDPVLTPRVGLVFNDLGVEGLALGIGFAARVIEVVLDRVAFDAHELCAGVSQADKKIAVFAPIGGEVLVIAVHLI